jgi:hypothetical protein
MRRKRQIQSKFDIAEQLLRCGFTVSDAAMSTGLGLSSVRKIAREKDIKAPVAKRLDAKRIRLAAHLYHDQGLSAAAVGEVMKISEGQVREHLRRGNCPATKDNVGRPSIEIEDFISRVKAVDKQRANAA